jgi:anthranilate phosphoribosyltransferase
VCKHGSRAASSQCGAADLLEALGVRIELTAEQVAHCVERAGIGFCFAPAFHPAFRFASSSRREIGIPTVFNLLGPMANPGRARRQVIGVANPAVAERMVTTLRAHGSIRSWVVHGQGLDELTTVGVSSVLELVDGGVRRFTVDPTELGFARALPEELEGGAPAVNAECARRVLAGDHGPHRDIVLLNAGAGLVVAGVAPDLPAGVATAAASIDSGQAAAALQALIETSNA